MTSKVVTLILKAVEKFLSKIVVVKRGYGENILRKGFNQAGYHCTLETLIILGDNKTDNKKKVDIAANKLIKECERLVRKDIEDDSEKLLVEEDSKQEEENEDKD